MTNRRFGVEIECGSTRLGPGGVGARLLTCRGLRSFAKDVGADGSGIEIRSPKLRGEKGLARLERLYATLQTPTFSCYTANVDGAHVHHDAPEFKGNWDLIEKLLRSWRNNEPYTFKFLPERRTVRAPLTRVRNSYGFTDEAFESRLKEKRIGAFGRTSLNVSPLKSYGSVEFRQLEGTFNFDRVRAWIEFGQQFLEYTLAVDHPWKARGHQHLLDMLDLPKDRQEVLLKAGA
jgi:hypothetical protein